MSEQNKISILDLSNAENLDKQKAAELFIQATKECGFIYIKLNESAATTIQSVRLAQNTFFDIDTQQKTAIAIDKNNRGYLGQGEALMAGAKRADLKEVFFWGREADDNDPDVLAGVPLCGANQWPEQLDGFRTAVEQYSHMVQSYGDLVLSIIAIALGQDENYFSAYYGRTMLRGQLLRYPPTGNDPDQFGVAQHSDFGCITLLYQETKGLEVLFPDGNWVAAPPIENTLVINVGDLLERWSNNHFPSTQHRVRNTSSDARYSIAMFYDPDPRAVVDPAELLPNEKPKFEAIEAAEYILSKNKKSFAHYKK